MRHRTRRPPLIVLGPPHPHGWLTGNQPNHSARWHFAVEVVHGGADPSWSRWACEQFRARWSSDELVRAVRLAGHLAPLPAWAAQLLRGVVQVAA